jgi:hypothetical protein
LPNEGEAKTVTQDFSFHLSLTLATFFGNQSRPDFVRLISNAAIAIAVLARARSRLLLGYPFNDSRPPMYPTRGFGIATVPSFL